MTLDFFTDSFRLLVPFKVYLFLISRLWDFVEVTFRVSVLQAWNSANDWLKNSTSAIWPKNLLFSSNIKKNLKIRLLVARIIIKMIALPCCDGNKRKLCLSHDWFKCKKLQGTYWKVLLEIQKRVLLPLRLLISASVW